MITEPLKRGEKCYWKFGNDGYGCAYFVSLNQMPTTPHAVKINHHDQEHIVKDYEVFSVKEKFEDQHCAIIGLLIGDYNCAKIAHQCHRDAQAAIVEAESLETVAKAYFKMPDMVDDASLKMAEAKKLRNRADRLLDTKAVKLGGCSKRV